MHLTRSVAAALLTSVVTALNSGDIKGSSFVDAKTGDRIQLLGVDYQPGGQAAFNAETGHDVLSDADQCLRDAVIMQQLGVNTIRVYNVNPKTNHDACMSIFNAAGIYVILDVNSPLVSLDRTNPASSYHVGYLEYIFGNVQNFMGYPNTLAFFSNNEVINDLDTAKANPPYMRAIQRDLKAFIAKNAGRHIPVGYSAADVREVLQDTWSYLTCSINGEAGDASRGELFGLNSYSWCGNASFKSAGYDVLVDMFKSTSVPVFFSEYGCNQVEGARPFTEVAALYGPDMTSLNGGLVYEYTQETSNYGLVELQTDGSIKLRKDFDNLQAQYNKLDKNLLKTAAGTTNTPPKCDKSLITNTGFNSTWSIPPTPSGGADLINNGVKSAAKGKLIDVSNLTPKFKIYGSNGNEVTGLKLSKIDVSNGPRGASTSGGVSGSSNSTTGGKKSEAGVGYSAAGKVAFGAAAALAALFML